MEKREDENFDMKSFDNILMDEQPEEVDGFSLENHMGDRDT